MTRVYVYKNDASAINALFDMTVEELPALHDFVRHEDKLYRVVAREWSRHHGNAEIVVIVNDASVTEVA